MLTIIQPVREARVTVQNKVTGEIGKGLLILLCAERGDTDAIAEKLPVEILKLRIFSDAAGKPYCLLHPKHPHLASTWPGLR